MIRYAHIHQPQKQRYRCLYDYARTFARHLGRKLTPQEHRIIFTFEKHRLTGRPLTFLIIDSPDFDSRSLLIRYQEWLHCDRKRAIMLPNLSRAKEIIPPDLQHPAKTFSAVKPDNVRGQTFASILLLDVDRYGRYSPGHEKSKFSRIITSAAPAVSDTHNALLVIHSSTPIYAPLAYCQPPPLPYLKTHLVDNGDRQPQLTCDIPIVIPLTITLPPGIEQPPEEIDSEQTHPRPTTR